MSDGRGWLARTRNWGEKGLPILAVVTINAEQHLYSTSIIGPILFLFLGALLVEDARYR